MDATTPPYELPEEGPQPFLRLPWPVSVVASALLAVQLAMSFFSAAAAGRTMIEYGFVPARYSPAFLTAHNIDGGTLIEKVLPFVTYIFLHANWTHVVVNTLWLLAFGPVVARRFGAWRFFAFFIVCGIAGAGLHLVLNWASLEPVVGASAAISGLMGAAFRLIGRDEAPGIEQAPPAPIFSRRIVLWSAIWIVLNVIAGMTGIGAGPGIQLIAWQAHVGGFLAGLFLTGLFDPVNRLNPAPL